MLRQHGMRTAGIAVAFLSGAPALAETTQGGAPHSSYNNVNELNSAAVAEHAVDRCDCIEDPNRLLLWLKQLGRDFVRSVHDEN